MPEYRFPQLVFEWPENLHSGVYLWVWNPDKVPPHIGISDPAGYYSLTYRDCEIAESTTAMTQKAKRSGIPLVLVDLSEWPFSDDFAVIFSQYDKAVPGGPTCLTPIRNLMKMGEEVRQLSDLFTQIELLGKMKPVFALHLEPTYQGIPDYSVAEIMSRIEQLHETKRSESSASSR